VLAERMCRVPPDDQEGASGLPGRDGTIGRDRPTVPGDDVTDEARRHD
jgi:hypothetical protein